MGTSAAAPENLSTLSFRPQSKKSDHFLNVLSKQGYLRAKEGAFVITLGQQT